jgi:hypothetical protein
LKPKYLPGARFSASSSAWIAAWHSPFELLLAREPENPAVLAAAARYHEKLGHEGQAVDPRRRLAALKGYEDEARKQEAALWLGEAFQGLPILDTIEADKKLRKGVRLDVEGQAGDPLDKKALAGVGEADRHVQDEGLPGRPQLVSVHGAPPVYGTAGFKLQLSP